MNKTSTPSNVAQTIAATASRIEGETKTLEVLTAKLRGLCFVEPAEIDRLRAVERAALAVFCSFESGSSLFEMPQFIALRDALAADWTLEKPKGADHG